MTDSELVDEAAKLDNQKELNRCDEVRLALVKDELASRREKSGYKSDEECTAGQSINEQT
ncbi:hypothetical protein O4214_13575 [Rhodococcus erythropolis]|uniref:hypothetical protein n=1 Tax=Rhodococcus erythropolis TaxID=1833 RepID=UPI001E63B6EE|nr:MULTISPECIES: hypothetical protein [Rhodococcus erythropolis group]MCD2104858.1 hypothetical protein [Rhodococcus qingshengii]MCZ4525014.1 hypothetical protein [Rhodococcus erythropolis]